MGLDDRDYMRERYRQPMGSGRPAGGYQPGAAAAGWRMPNWVLVFLLSMTAVYLVARTITEFQRSVPFPPSGDVHWYLRIEQPAVAPLTLSAPEGVGRNFAVRLDDWESHNPIALIPVREGESSVTLLPLGRYRLTIATGKVWQGTDRLFGSDTQLRQAAYPVDFYVRDNQTMGRRIQLEVPFNGNMETVPGKW